MRRGTALKRNGCTLGGSIAIIERRSLSHNHGTKFSLLRREFWNPMDHWYAQASPLNQRRMSLESEIACHQNENNKATPIRAVTRDFILKSSDDHSFRRDAPQRAARAQQEDLPEKH
jgi:hypothetical protein